MCDFNPFLCIIILVFVMQMFELAFFSDIDRQMMLEDTTRNKKLGDVLLGTCEVPMSTVLTHRTGNTH